MDEDDDFRSHGASTPAPVRPVRPPPAPSRGGAAQAAEAGSKEMDPLPRQLEQQ